MKQPAFQGVDVVTNTNADNKDIRDLIVSIVPSAARQMVGFSDQFRGASETQTCKNIFEYLKNQIKYKADGGEQIVKLPSALMSKKVGDCKSYSLFTAAILQNLGIPYRFVFASYNSDPIPGHVYVQTDKGCIIDAVWGKFNSEKKPKYKYFHNMNVRYMAGTNGYKNVSGISINNAGMQGPGVNKVLLAPGRGIFLALIKGNRDGLATKLQAQINQNSNKLKERWEHAGGKYSKLVSAIQKGASKPFKKLGLLGVFKRLFRKKGLTGHGMGAGEGMAAIQAAIVSACTAAGTAIGPPIGTAGGASLGAALAALAPIFVDFVKQTPAADEADTVDKDIIAPENDQEGGDGAGTTFNFSKAFPYIAAGSAALYFLTSKNSKK